MARPPHPASVAATDAARMVYPETELTDHGQELLVKWSEASEEASEELEELWAQDWPAVLRAFRRTEGALKALNGLRAEEEEAPLTTEEELQEEFQESTAWELTHVGELAGFPIRVWSYSPWDGALAYALAVAPEATFSAPTTLE